MTLSVQGHSRAGRLQGKAKRFPSQLRAKARAIWLATLFIVSLTACTPPRVIPYALPPADLPAQNVPKEAMPYFWPDPTVPEPKWPQAHPDAVYREGMTPRQYFEHLCKLEAGEFVYRTVLDVESIYFVRLQGQPKPSVTRHPELIEDPYGVNQHFLGWWGMGGFLQGNSPRGMDIGQGKEHRTVVTEMERRQYRFVEAPQPYFRGGAGIPNHDTFYFEWNSLLRPVDTRPTRSSQSEGVTATYRPGRNPHAFETLRWGEGTKYVRLERNPDEIVKIHRSPYNPNTFSLYSHNDWINLDYTDRVTSRYGVVWRGIQRPRDRELGIGGGEILLLDLRTNEILAVKRGFAFNKVWTHRGTSIKQTDWYGADVCPKWDAGGDFNFVQAVLIPPLVQLKPPIEE